MNWLDFCHGTEKIVAVYKEAKPSIQGSTVRSFELSRDYANIKIVLDLPEYPKHPPKKWDQRGCDTVRVTLSMSGIRDIRLIGPFGSQNISLSIDKVEERLFYVQLQCLDRVYMSAHTDLIDVHEMQAYKLQGVKN